ncbi:MAG: chemotaxis-specific protein-glutamate methyltransferase CheB [Nannocystaceae bacterium]|nr:chemotaxis-specific protein-glutamate methyltransferase CheB [Nannocystaceae bacterium]
MPSDSDTLRVLVVDDSAYNRQTIAAMLESIHDVVVVGRAMNGKEALQLAFDLEPDVITLDLEMPEMDGFSFLRLLMSRRPTPVLVVSGYSQRENVFRALELGALDFIAKPSRDISPDLKTIADELVAKIRMVRRLSAVRLSDRARSLAEIERANTVPIRIAPKSEETPPVLNGPPPGRVIGIASSTGGPPALQQLLCALDPSLPVAVLVAQHMPARFTKAFAERLDRIVGARVVEAIDGMPLCAGVVYIAPGQANIEVQYRSRGLPHPVIRVVAAERRRGTPVLTPSGDHLFTSLAREFGQNACVVVLTGMGSDGRDGARVAHGAGATVMAEDPATAVMPGMPHSVVETGLVDEVHPIESMAAALTAFARRPRSRR